MIMGLNSFFGFGVEDNYPLITTIGWGFVS
jgi:hypothetical protein